MKEEAAGDAGELSTENVQGWVPLLRFRVERGDVAERCRLAPIFFSPAGIH
jgi:hypothetical protein